MSFNRTIKITLLCALFAFSTSSILAGGIGDPQFCESINTLLDEMDNEFDSAEIAVVRGSDSGHRMWDLKLLLPGSISGRISERAGLNLEYTYCESMDREYSSAIYDSLKTVISGCAPQEWIVEEENMQDNNTLVRTLYIWEKAGGYFSSERISSKQLQIKQTRDGEYYLVKLAFMP